MPIAHPKRLLTLHEIRYRDEELQKPSISIGTDKVDAVIRGRITAWMSTKPASRVTGIDVIGLASTHDAVPSRSP